MLTLTKRLPKLLTPEQIFMASAFVVNGGNYAYNLILGRVLGPAAFADAAILITMLLVLSFVAMTFQLAVAKFTAGFEPAARQIFIASALRYATAAGIGLGVLCVLSASALQQLFNTASPTMFVIFGLAIPLYFVMSVNRGNLQGNQLFVKLSVTYQLEMLVRLVLTFSLLLFFKVEASYAVSIAIGISFIAGMFPYKKNTGTSVSQTEIPPEQYRQILKFFALTATYELTQIICNNSDILLVKHYFEAYDAGLYASLALIGRVVYFVTWMFVMILLPKVVQLRKEGQNPLPVLKNYLGYIGLLSLSITAFTFLFPGFSVRLLFGSAYLAVSPLLGWYALATSLFALSNVFAYYFLSLDHYKPVALAGIFGVVQVLLIVFFHGSLLEVVIAQVIAMGLLLGAQLTYFVLHTLKLKKTSS
ncbi:MULTISPECIES: sugar isomerase [unclassified Leeuwenhoekiella]|uniref:sugar isomerase n=1 Tax=unclassified Leeuwenhoekiella TaxID=2615029 RepID=UPI000C6517DB|nr:MULTISPECIES: sugar isomerase [unclassified Leeuwenhoekiella]MAW97025.1 sugar isomerase [Leeuwenhoekiella sp.]MBA80694.1 sugar isomerase [Leeuwenhoekiella sp.]|tara:strand:- start:37402 stop:38658 length:1257 start_codon:yes stop_codon:yes gene_type:complete